MSVKRICTICARGGSKGLPGKNIKPLLGRPLLAHSIEQARSAELFDAIAVSSDSEKILAVAKSLNVEFCIERPANLAVDTASKLPAIRHCTLEVEEKIGAPFDVIVDIDVTSPLRKSEDIIGAVDLMEKRNVTNVITGATARKNPYFNMVEQQADGHVDLCIRLKGDRLERRQDCPSVFDMNAAVYAWRRSAFMEKMDIFYPDTLLYEMPEERSHDIDTPTDFKFVEFLLSEQK